MSQTEIARSRTDLFFRRLLRIGDRHDSNAVFGARRATTAAIVVSGIRCIITYLLIPFLTPLVAFLADFAAPISLTLCVAAIITSINGLRRFWIADHPARLAYTGFIGVMLVLLTAAIVADIVAIVG